MKMELPEPHEFGQGDAPAFLILWLMGGVILVCCFVTWISGTSVDAFPVGLGLFSIFGLFCIVWPFVPMIYKAHLKIRRQDEQSRK